MSCASFWSLPWSTRLTVAFALALVVAAEGADAQDALRRPLEHADYDVWNTMSRPTLSGDGNWAVYSVQSGAIDGEATLHIYNLKTAREYVIERGSGATLSFDSRFAVYRVTPDKKRLKQLRKEKKSTDELPKSMLQILELSSGDVRTIEDASSYALPEENGDWVACWLESPSAPDQLADKKSPEREVYEVTPSGLRRPEKPLKLKSREELALARGEKEPEPTVQEPASEKSSKAEKEPNDAADEADKKKATGKPLKLINLNTGIERTFPAVVDYEFSKNGETLAFATSVKADDAKAEKSDGEDGDGEDGDRGGPVDGFHILTLDSLALTTVAEGPGEYKNMSFNEDGTQLAFITNKDDYDTKTSTWAVYHWNKKSKTANKIATEGDSGIPAGWWIAPSSNQSFSEDGQRLYFDTAPVPDDILEEREAKAAGRDVKEDDQEKAKLDVWHWQDPQLQPQQLLQAAAERNRDYRAAYVMKSKKIVQLATRQIPSVNIGYRATADIAVANTNMRYRKMLSWDVPGFQDAYLVDLNTGDRELVLEQVKWNASLSPEGKFITWFDGEQAKWFAKATDDSAAEPIEISQGIEFPLQDELHDTPNLPGAYGSAGWMQDDAGFLVYDAYDIWKLDPTGKAPVCITAGFGRDHEIRFRYLQLDAEQRSVDPSQPMMLEAFHRKTKASGFYVLNLAAEPTADENEEEANEESDDSPLRQLIMLDESLEGLQKAKQSDTVLFTRSTFRKCPDIWSSTTAFGKISRVSDINPQQDEYAWGTAELTHWKATDGQELDGILLKPDGFDPSKKYPLMVYFYERNSDNLHSYYTPEAGRSIICHSFYVSRGYVVFIPDIPYTTGEPGPSAANAILPGVEHLVAQGFVDEAKIGMQGHSWGGYQTAYLVTQTDMFACAESGAPVSNMTSAYGGIRWSSGMSRMFQYERTQSRIGDTLWSAQDKYLANSPLFFADKINTPLLILHNDEDGAVPWYQGIELFVALRRLEKPAWMLNYNGNPHWVMGDYNRRDFAIRMQQFFDHYLMDAPEPEWMAVGVPAVDKGENFGLELLEPEHEADPPMAEAIGSVEDQ